MPNNTTVFGADVRRTVEQSISKVGGLLAYRFVKADGSDYAGANDTTAGVGMNACTAADVTAGTAVMLCVVEGIALCYANGAISQYARVECDANGQVGTYSSSLIRGKALAAALGAGDLIPVLLSQTA